jgi:hypothetical protein
MLDYILIGIVKCLVTLNKMLESTLETCLQKDPFTKKIYAGVFAFDELPDQLNYPACLIVNTKPRTQFGEHWLGIFYDKDKNGEFFDSYGMHPSYYRLKSYMDKTATKWTHNKRRIQGFSSYCGYYSLLYLLFRARLKSQLFFSYFTTNFFLNDKKVKILINKFK